MLISREIQTSCVLRMSLPQPSVREHAVDSEMAGVVAHVVDATVAEVRQHIGVVQPSHGDFADTHFQECAERGIYPLFSLFRAEARRSRKVPAFHDPTTNEDLRMPLS